MESYRGMTTQMLRTREVGWLGTYIRTLNIFKRVCHVNLLVGIYKFIPEIGVSSEKCCNSKGKKVKF